jgi:hypothetical protein
MVARRTGDPGQVGRHGPVLALEDVAGGKVCALASRVEARDYADTARMPDRYSPAQLIGFAIHLGPGLTEQDFAHAGGQLDGLPTKSSPATGLGHHDVAALRAKFATWPRTPPGSQQCASCE